MKILIVDDNSDDRELLRLIIERYGHQVIEACNGQEGLSIAANQKPNIIISDALMPVMDGFQFLRSIKKDKTLNSIPFIFYSATYKEYQDAELALSLGADAFIIKPKDPAELWKEIEDILKENKLEKPVTAQLIEEDEEYLKRYSEIVAIKLEEKIRELEGEIATRRQLEEEREKLIFELQDALAKVKTLSGMLPICSSCKKIRDDKGYWNQIESYISENSEVLFSHSLCPDCAEKMLEEIKEMKLKKHPGK